MTWRHPNQKGNLIIKMIHPKNVVQIREMIKLPIESCPIDGCEHLCKSGTREALRWGQGLSQCHQVRGTGQVWGVHNQGRSKDIEFLKSTYPSQRVNLHILQWNSSSTCTVILYDTVMFLSLYIVVGDLKGAQERWIATGLSPERVCFDCSGDCLPSLHLESNHVCDVFQQFH